MVIGAGTGAAVASRNGRMVGGGETVQWRHASVKAKLHLVKVGWGRFNVTSLLEMLSLRISVLYLLTTDIADPVWSATKEKMVVVRTLIASTGHALTRARV
jgi:hypothetical protein